MAKGRQFVLVTKGLYGIGWAKKLMEEGETVTVAHECEDEDPEDRKRYKQVGKGWLKMMPLQKALATLKSPTTYWIFALNHLSEEADALRADGQKVFGTSVLTDRMEHDRKFATDLAKQCGLSLPATHEFTTRQEGLTFLDDNMNKAYVFKPDDGKFNYMTFVPIRQDNENANRETYTYLAHMKQEPGTYILQERINPGEGTEVCVEAWMYEGEPFLATMGLEVKRKNSGDLGEMAGCGGDFSQVIPVDCPLVQQTVGKMFEYYEKERYTGIADVNVIITDKGPQFLEVCNRFGYNAHITLFLGLAKDGFGDIIADFIDGKTYGMDERFRAGSACSVTLSLDHPREGLPLHIDEMWEEHFFPLEDGYKEDDTFLLAGYSNEVGVFVDYGETMEQAWGALWNKLHWEEAVSYPDIYYRTDLIKTDYDNNPVERYKTLEAML